MKDSIAFYSGAAFSIPFSAYLSSNWFVVLTIIFIFVIGVCGGLFGLAIKYFIKERLKIHGH